MAWSRLEKIGTIFSRVNGLIRSGALKEENQPLWFELYKRIPPIEEPRFDRPAKDVPIRKIFYPEDEVRAKFHKLYGAHMRENLKDYKQETKCQQFIKTYYSLKDKGDLHGEEIFDKTVEVMGLRTDQSEGKFGKNIRNLDEKVLGGFQRNTLVSNFVDAREKRDGESKAVPEINLKDIFKE